MGQEQSGLAFRPSETEEYDPPILQDKDHKALEDRASKVLRETQKENSDQRQGPQPDRAFEDRTPGGEVWPFFKHSICSNWLLEIDSRRTATQQSPLMHLPAYSAILSNFSSSRPRALVISEA